jgi:hypothetical protein
MAAYDISTCDHGGRHCRRRVWQLRGGPLRQAASSFLHRRRSRAASSSGGHGSREAGPFGRRQAPASAPLVETWPARRRGGAQSPSAARLSRLPRQCVCSGAGDGQWRPELTSVVERATSGRGAVQSIPWMPGVSPHWYFAGFLKTRC